MKRDEPERENDAKEGILSIDTDVGGRLSVDEDHRLLWNGELLVTEQRVRLDRWVNLAIIVTSVATAAIAAVAVIQVCR